jgi:RNA polymerase sigma-70 factor (ECF subfamily)
VSGSLKSDLDLARELLAGNEEAFTEFVRSFRTRLANYTFLMCGRREDAEEVAQETLLKVFESIDRLREPERLKSWVFRIARNECLMMRRKSVFAPTMELSLDELKPNRSEDGRGSEIADWSALPEDLVFQAELRGALTEAIRNLPEIYRAVVLLRDVEELSTEETAEVLDISADTVKTRLYRGRLALRKSLDARLRAAGIPS